MTGPHVGSKTKTILRRPDYKVLYENALQAVRIVMQQRDMYCKTAFHGSPDFSAEETIKQDNKEIMNLIRIKP